MVATVRVVVARSPEHSSLTTPRHPSAVTRADATWARPRHVRRSTSSMPSRESGHAWQGGSPRWPLQSNGAVFIYTATANLAIAGTHCDRSRGIPTARTARIVRLPSTGMPWTACMAFATYCDSQLVTRISLAAQTAWAYNARQVTTVSPRAGSAGPRSPSGRAA